MNPTTPTHDLTSIKQKVAVGFVHYRREALEGAFALKFSPADMADCLLALTAQDFHKSMPARNPKWSGCWQDVYKLTFNGKRVYVKLQLFPGQKLHIVSFKDKDEDGND